MLHRSTSSRRRRASRSTASSPRPPRAAATSPGRRASIAASPGDGERRAPDPSRSPRHSIIPDIALHAGSSQDLAPSGGRSPRHSLVPGDESRSPRHSLVPGDDSRSPRHSLVPGDDARSPRHSLVPGDDYRSPRHSLVPGDDARSPRLSLVPGDEAMIGRSPRHSLVPDVSNMRSPRHSLVPGDEVAVGRSPRHSLVPNDSYSRSPRNSIIPDIALSPRNSLVPPSRSPRPSLTPTEAPSWPPADEPPRGGQRSPRGSVAVVESLSRRTSPRGSIGSEHTGERSPRGSIGPESNGGNRSPRGSLGGSRLTADECGGRSPRGSLQLTFQEPLNRERRASADNASGMRGRSTSPYRSASRGTMNAGYTGTSGYCESGSRRASSSVSQVALPQVSGDEQRRLCADSGKYSDGGQALGIGISLTTYGSVAYQLKDANLEASGTCDFVCKALSIVNKTVVATILLVCLSTLPLLMLIMGIQFLRDCPREQYIPIYMVVGGSVGCVKMGLTLYNQLHTRRMDAVAMNATSYGSKISSVVLTVFLMIWFGLGNYWILRIKWPDYAPTLFEPNRWCHRTLYVFSLVHLCVLYSVLGVIVILVFVLAGCQLFGCPWLGPARYK